jgi:hypothetical protein
VGNASVKNTVKKKMSVTRFREGQPAEQTGHSQDNDTHASRMLTGRTDESTEVLTEKEFLWK